MKNIIESKSICTWSDAYPLSKVIDIEISPNPANDILKINSPNIGELIKIVDVFGKVIYSQILEQESTTIDLSVLPPGCYFIDPSLSRPKTFIKL